VQQAVRLYRAATSCFGRVGAHQGGRLVLSLFFKAVLGVQRIFHFDSLSDVGFALLTGGCRCLSRRTLGGLVRAVSTRAVGKFLQLTRPVVSAAEHLHVSIDEHVVARFTRKFLIPKGFHTIRNKKMRAEKLFFSFDTATRTLLDSSSHRATAAWPLSPRKCWARCALAAATACCAPCLTRGC
jgi:hypothetical protein